MYDEELESIKVHAIVEDAIVDDATRNEPEACRPGLMSNFVKELWTLLSAYKFRGYTTDGKEAFAVPLSWLLIFFLLVFSL